MRLNERMPRQTKRQRLTMTRKATSAQIVTQAYISPGIWRFACLAAFRFPLPCHDGTPFSPFTESVPSRSFCLIRSLHIPFIHRVKPFGVQTSSTIKGSVSTRNSQENHQFHSRAIVAKSQCLVEFLSLVH